MSRFQRPEGEGRATSLELFYDLVFVFAITQLSHLLLSHVTWAGAGQTAVLLLAVWWTWNYTTWATNELDPDAIAVRLLLIALMLLSLLMAVAIPEAFTDRALLFAISYVTIQVGRSAFLAYVVAPADSLGRERAFRIMVWFIASGVLWIAGALAEGEARTFLWIGALLIDYGAPSVVYWVPWRKPIEPGSWQVETSHFAERFGLFVIIALGESIVVTGSTTSNLDLDTITLVAFAVAFLGSAALWWLYFDYVSNIAQRHLELAENRTTMARDAYTYLHALIIAAVIVAAVGDEIVIAHPSEHLHGAELTAVIAGPALYLFSLVVLRLRLAGSIGWQRLFAMLATLATALLAPYISALAILSVLVAILAAVVVNDQILRRRRIARGEPSPIERLEGAAGAGA